MKNRKSICHESVYALVNGILSKEKIPLDGTMDVLENFLLYLKNGSKTEDYMDGFAKCMPKVIPFIGWVVMQSEYLIHPQISSTLSDILLIMLNQNDCIQMKQWATIQYGRYLRGNETTFNEDYSCMLAMIQKEIPDPKFYQNVMELSRKTLSNAPSLNRDCDTNEKSTKLLPFLWNPSTLWIIEHFLKTLKDDAIISPKFVHEAFVKFDQFSPEAQSALLQRNYTEFEKRIELIVKKCSLHPSSTNSELFSSVPFAKYFQSHPFAMCNIYRYLSTLFEQTNHVSILFCLRYIWNRIEGTFNDCEFVKFHFPHASFRCWIRRNISKVEDQAFWNHLTRYIEQNGDHHLWIFLDHYHVLDQSALKNLEFGQEYIAFRYNCSVEDIRTSVNTQQTDNLYLKALILSHFENWDEMKKLKGAQIRYLIQCFPQTLDIEKIKKLISTFPHFQTFIQEYFNECTLIE